MFSILELGCTAVAAEAVSRATSFLIGKYNKDNNVQEWIDRLVMAQIEIESALLISKEFDINYEPLHQWQEKLKEAVCEAKEALSNFLAETEILHEEPNQSIEGGSSARDQSVQEEGSDNATLSHPASNIREAVAHQVNLEENLPHDQSLHEEGSDDATLVLPASNFREVVVHQVNLEADLPYDQSVHEEAPDIEEELEAIFREGQCISYKRFIKLLFRDFKWRNTDSPWPAIIERLSAFSRLLDPKTFSLLDPRMMVVKYLENDEKVSKLIKTVEKLEKMAGEIGVFIELLKLQLKRKMCRKRKRSGVALQAFFLVLPLKLQTYALFCYGEDPYLLVIMLLRAICNVPTGITGDIFIELIM